MIPSSLDTTAPPAVPADLSTAITPRTAPVSARPLAAWLALTALMLACVLGVRHLAPPAPRGMDAPANAFSAARALVQLAPLAQQPHPVGSPANAAVRAHLLTQLSALGLAPRVQDAFAVPRDPDRHATGTVHNVLARLPGHAAGGRALLVVAHYDSVAHAAGAADNGASVAAVLETVRALRAGAPLRNDLIVLFTDGEEAGLLGAQAFVDEHPWAREVGAALNFEFRGNRGPMLMFETSRGNAALIQALADAPGPVAASWQVEVYRRLPNNTDFSVLQQAGLAGMNFAAIEGATAYHSALDTIDRLDPATLQHEGDLMLSLVRHLGDAALPLPATEDRVYSNLAGLGLVNYPADWARPIAFALAAAFAALLVQAVRSGDVRPGRAFACVPFLVLLMAACGVAGQFLWMGVNLVHPGYRLMPDTYNSHWYLLAFAGLFAATTAAALRGLSTWFTAPELGVAGTGLWVLAGLLAGLQMPGVTPLLAWPLAPVLAATAWRQSRVGRAASPDTQLAVRVLGALPALLLLAPVVQCVYVALSPRMMMVTVLLLMAVFVLLAPLWLDLWRRWLVPAAPLALAAACLAAGAATAGFDVEHRRANSLSWVQLPGTDRALWLSVDRVLDEWTQQFFPADAVRREVTELHGPQARKTWTGPARSLALPAPTIDLVDDRLDEHGQRRVVLHIGSRRAARMLQVWVEDTTVLTATVQGRPYTEAPTGPWQVGIHGLPASGVDIALTVAPGQPFAVRAADRTDGLPLDGLPTRGPALMAQPAAGGDTTEVFTRREMK